LPGCFVLREAGGAMEIRAWRQQHQCRSAVVVGGGVLGIEAADALRRLNLTVTILQRTDRLMERQLDAKGSAILERYLAGLGIRVVTDVSGLTCRGDSRLETVQLADGEVMEAEIMVACAGIGPNAEIARDAGLEVERGVKVDRSMRSSDPDIFAVGDVAELPGSISGLWAVSTAQGRVAAAALFGRESSYSEPSTLVNLKMDGIDVKSYGLISASSAEQETITGVGDGEDEHRLLIVEGGRLLGAIFVGPPGTGRHVADLVEQKPDLTPILDDLRRGDWDALSRVVGAPRVAQAAE
jgi:NAD(P)H-nitrite reductase large subunit